MPISSILINFAAFQPNFAAIGYAKGCFRVTMLPFIFDIWCTTDKSKPQFSKAFHS